MPSLTEVVRMGLKLSEGGKLSPKEFPLVESPSASKDVDLKETTIAIADETTHDELRSMYDHEIFILCDGEDNLKPVTYNSERDWGESLKDILAKSEEFDLSDSILAVITVKPAKESEKKEIRIIRKPVEGWKSIMDPCSS